jgi:hypothetical protein
MILYREVSPEKGPGLYLYKHVHDFADAKYVHALEPIEITEEEIKRIITIFGNEMVGAVKNECAYPNEDECVQAIFKLLNK